jgi:hypothetical protein
MKTGYSVVRLRFQPQTSQLQSGRVGCRVKHEFYSENGSKQFFVVYSTKTVLTAKAIFMFLRLLHVKIQPSHTSARTDRENRYKSVNLRS